MIPPDPHPPTTPWIPSMDPRGQRLRETVQVGGSCSPTVTPGGRERKLQPLSPHLPAVTLKPRLNPSQTLLFLLFNWTKWRGEVCGLQGFCNN